MPEDDASLLAADGVVMSHGDHEGLTEQSALLEDLEESGTKKNVSRNS